MKNSLQIRPGVALVIWDQQRRLLLHRRRIGQGWAPVSGSIEPGESIEAAAYREATEETGLTIRFERLVGVYSRPEEQVVEYPDGRSVHFITILLSAHSTAGNLAGNTEGYEWGWFVPDALPGPMLQYAQTWIADAISDSPTVLR